MKLRSPRLPARLPQAAPHLPHRIQPRLRRIILLPHLPAEETAAATEGSGGGGGRNGQQGGPAAKAADGARFNKWA